MHQAAIIPIDDIQNKLGELTEVLYSHRKSEATNRLESALKKLVIKEGNIDRWALGRGQLTAEQRRLVLQWFNARRFASRIEDNKQKRLSRAAERYNRALGVIKEIRALCGV